MIQNNTTATPHISAKLGLLSLLVGVVGSLVAYMGLWTDFSILGLIGFLMVAVAALGGVVSVIWYAVSMICKGRHQSG